MSTTITCITIGMIVLWFVWGYMKTKKNEKKDK
jgi:hypothetical protein